MESLRLDEVEVWSFLDQPDDELGLWFEASEGADAPWRGHSFEKLQGFARAWAAYTGPSRWVWQSWCQHVAGSTNTSAIAHWASMIVSVVDWLLRKENEVWIAAMPDSRVALGEAEIAASLSNDARWSQGYPALVGLLYASGLVRCGPRGLLPTQLYRDLGGQSLLPDHDCAKAKSADPAERKRAQDVSGAPVVALPSPRDWWNWQSRAEEEKRRQAWINRMLERSPGFCASTWLEALAHYLPPEKIEAPGEVRDWVPWERICGFPSASLERKASDKLGWQAWANVLDRGRPLHPGVGGAILEARHLSDAGLCDLATKLGWPAKGRRGSLRRLNAQVLSRERTKVPAKVRGLVERWGCFPRSPRVRVPWDLVAPPCIGWGGHRPLTLTGASAWTHALRGLPGKLKLGALEWGWRAHGGDHSDPIPVELMGTLFLARARVYARQGFKAGAVKQGRRHRPRSHSLAIDTNQHRMRSPPRTPDGWLHLHRLIGPLSPPEPPSPALVRLIESRCEPYLEFWAKARASHDAARQRKGLPLRPYTEG